MRETSVWRNSLSETRRQVRGRANLPLLLRALEKLEMRGQLWVQQLAKGFPAIGDTGGPGGYPVGKSRRQPEMEPERLLGANGGGIRARMSGARGPGAVQLRGGAKERVDEGWLEGRAP